MNDNKKPIEETLQSSAFELSTPDVVFAASMKTSGHPGSQSPADAPTACSSSAPCDENPVYPKMGWRGLSESEPCDDVTLRSTPRTPSADLDMTSMVDVTFLLLIFFMITASFTLQKSIEQQKTNDRGSTAAPQEFQNVEVRVDANNTFYVSTGEVEDLECPSESEMRSQVKAGLQSPWIDRVLIIAHPDSSHAAVVNVWDAGAVNGASHIEIKTSSEFE